MAGGGEKARLGQHRRFRRLFLRQQFAGGIPYPLFQFALALFQRGGHAVDTALQLPQFTRGDRRDAHGQTAIR